MMSRANFSKGLTRLAIACGKDLDEGVFEVYRDALAGQFSDGAGWDAFIRSGVAGGRWRWFPTVAELVTAIREVQTGEPLEAEATRAYEAVTAASTYTAEGGDRWIYRTIRERCGEAAAEAFLTAGGDSAWRSSWDAEKRRQAFVRAYVGAVRDRPEARLLPPGRAPLALPAGDVEPSSPITLESARGVLLKLADLVPGPKAKPMLRVVGSGMTDEQWAARLAYLRVQAEHAAEHAVDHDTDEQGSSVGSR